MGIFRYPRVIVDIDSAGDNALELVQAGQHVAVIGAYLVADAEVVLTVMSGVDTEATPISGPIHLVEGIPFYFDVPPNRSPWVTKESEDLNLYLSDGVQVSGNLVLDIAVGSAAMTEGETSAWLNRAMTFFTNSDITAAEAETLTDDSAADALHCHGGVEASTHVSASPNVITAAENGKTFTNEGTGAKNYHTLPTAAANLQFTFIVQDADGMRITAASGDTIRIGDGVTAAAGYVESTQIGSIIVLRAINATEWIGGVLAGSWA